MKILEGNVGSLTNFEVLDFLKSRGATTDPLGSLGVVSTSECKVFSSLAESAACNQTRDSIDEFLKRCEKFRLSKTEIIDIINLRPSSQALLFPIIRNLEARLVINEDEGINQVQELVGLVAEVLPPPPSKPEEEQLEDAQQEMQR